MIRIDVQADDFTVADEYQRLQQASSAAGAIAVFVGLVRDHNLGDRVSQLHLEHYPGMTERAITEFAEMAAQRWPLLDITVIHRVGTLRVQDQIVFVGVSSAHRDAAFAACDCLMDYLKSQAPFWKKERWQTDDGAWCERWIEPEEKDRQSLQRWNNESSTDTL